MRAERLLCPIRSSSSAHFRADGSCRCREVEPPRVDWLLGNARNYIDQRGELSHIGDRMLADAVEMLDAYRQVLVKIAGDRFPGPANERGKVEATWDALDALGATGGDGPVHIPVPERQHPQDRTIGDRRARLRREARQAPGEERNG